MRATRRDGGGAPGVGSPGAAVNRSASCALAPGSPTQAWRTLPHLARRRSGVDSPDLPRPHGARLASVRNLLLLPAGLPRAGRGRRGDERDRHDRAARDVRRSPGGNRRIRAGGGTAARARGPRADRLVLPVRGPRADAPAGCDRDRASCLRIRSPRWVSSGVRPFSRCGCCAATPRWWSERLLRHQTVVALLVLRCARSTARPTRCAVVPRGALSSPPISAAKRPPKALLAPCV